MHQRSDTTCTSLSGGAQAQGSDRPLHHQGNDLEAHRLTPAGFFQCSEKGHSVARAGLIRPFRALTPACRRRLKYDAGGFSWTKCPAALSIACAAGSFYTHTAPCGLTPAKPGAIGPRTVLVAANARRPAKRVPMVRGKGFQEPVQLPPGKTTRGRLQIAGCQEKPATQNAIGRALYARA